MRQHRNSQPKKLFTPNQLNSLIEAASPQVKAMILLGINCGFGNTDSGTLTIDRIENGWHNHPRPKTGVERRARLWPETVAALLAVIGDRETGCVFVTRYGKPWITRSSGSPISAEFRKLHDERAADGWLPSGREVSSSATLNRALSLWDYSVRLAIASRRHRPDSLESTSNDAVRC